MSRADDNVGGEMSTLRVAAIGEAATGLALMLCPGLVAQLLFGADVVGAGLSISRVAGMALVALGIACWPGADAYGRPGRGRAALLVYSALATIYLGVVAAEGELRGPLIWPAVVLHVVVTVLLATGRATSPRAVTDR